MGQPNDTRNTPGAQSKTLNSQPSECIIACGCGFGGKPTRGTQGERCPLGMPWLCLRQMALPFGEPSDRRKTRHGAGGTPGL